MASHAPTDRKRELDRTRTQWRKEHRTLNGRIILYPLLPPEHVNARGSKVYSWFWRKILLELQPQEIPAVISTLQDRIKGTTDPSSIQRYRTMIGMADDCYQFRQLEDIRTVDTDLQLGPTPVFDSEEGVVYRNGTIMTTDYNEEESTILLRDIEGILLDALSSEDGHRLASRDTRTTMYKNWRYSKD